MKIRPKKAVIFLLVVLVSLWVYLLQLAYGGKENTAPPEPNVVLHDGSPVDAIAIGSQLPVSRALAAKMIALSFLDIQTIEQLESNASFSDVSEEMWFYPYVHAVYAHGYMSGMKDGDFLPLEPLTTQQAQILLDKINPNNKVQIQITEENKDTPISYELWTELFLNQLKEMAGESDLSSQYGLTYKNLIVIGTPGNSDQIPPWHLVADSGWYRFSGYSVDTYIDKEIQVVVKNNEIMALLTEEQTQPLIRSVYIDNYEDGAVSVFAQGIYRTYEYYGQEDESGLADITVSDGKAVQITPYDQWVQGDVNRLSAEYAEIDFIRYEYWPWMNVYDNTGDFQLKSKQNILVGAHDTVFYLKEDKIAGAVIQGAAYPETIRVAINTTNFDSLIHAEIALTATADYKIIGSQLAIEGKQGEVLRINENENSALWNQNRVRIETDGLIQILSIERNNGYIPYYGGSIEIAKEEGGYSIVNEIGFEEYLHGVIPGEMPTSYPLEALKAQAITARSYAFNQYYLNRFCQYGAHVDDSTASQVYNNLPVDESAKQAVLETAKNYLTYDGKVISANFFSTSAGVTANAGEVWTENLLFSAATPAYLQSVNQTYGPVGDLSTEEAAAAFFKNWDIDGFEKEQPWFRWKVSFTVKELEQSINTNLKTVYDKSSGLVKTRTETGEYESRPIQTIGELQDIQITKRGTGGNAMEMVAYGSQATVLIMTENNIRALLRPYQYFPEGGDIIIQRIDGSQVANYDILPSGFFVIEKTIGEEGWTDTVLYGGGNGHGVGMSQNGAKALAEAGYSAQEILQHFYTGVDIVVLEN